MTPELQNLYRQVAQALDAEGVAHWLLDKCSCTHPPKMEHCLACAHDRSPKRHGDWCTRCNGHGVVVPSEAECFWRLTLTSKGCEVRQMEPDSWLAWHPGDDLTGFRGSSPLAALLRAVAQSVGVA